MLSKIILDEHKEAQRIMDEGFSGNINFYELSMVAKFLREEGFGFRRIYVFLVDLCKKYDKYFNPVANRKILRDAVNSCKKFKLKDNVTRVFITEKELEALKSVSNRYAKILFVMLVIAKKEKFSSTRISGRKPPEKIGYFFNYPIESAIRIARVRITKEELNHFKYEMDAKMGFINATLWSSSSWRIAFADDSSKISLVVDDFENLMDFLPFFCEKCGNFIERTGKRQKYCKDCWVDRNRELKRNWWNKEH